MKSEVKEPLENKSKTMFNMGLQEILSLIRHSQKNAPVSHLSEDPVGDIEEEIEKKEFKLFTKNMEHSKRERTNQEFALVT